MGLLKSLKAKTKHASSASSTNASSGQQSSSSQENPNYSTHQRNVSSSNLSTTSTLTEFRTSNPSRPSPPSRMTSYEAFLHQAQIDEDKKAAQARAWKVAAQRRSDNSMWPATPWTGGFGMPYSNGVGGQRVEGWLASNGMRS